MPTAMQARAVFDAISKSINKQKIGQKKIFVQPKRSRRERDERSVPGVQASRRPSRSRRRHCGQSLLSCPTLTEFVV